MDKKPIIPLSVNDTLKFIENFISEIFENNMTVKNITFVWNTSKLHWPIEYTDFKILRIEVHWAEYIKYER